MSKDAEIKVRVSQQIKDSVIEAAQSRGESESFIVREALRAYLAGTGRADVLSETPPKYGAKPSKNPK